GCLPVSPSLRPQALRPQLLEVLRRLQQGERMLLAVRRPEVGHFIVTTLPLPEGAEDGAAQILAFQQRFDAGNIDLTVAYPRLSNEQLAAVHDIATRMGLRGIRLP